MTTHSPMRQRVPAASLGNEAEDEHSRRDEQADQGPDD